MRSTRPVSATERGGGGAAPPGSFRTSRASGPGPVFPGSGSEPSHARVFPLTDHTEPKWTTRPETPADRDAVHGVNTAAFPTRDEADLVDALRADPRRGCRS